MRQVIQSAAVVASVLGALAPMSAAAQQTSDTPLATARTPTVQDQLQQQQARIEQQDARIEQLEDQLHQVTAILSNRVDRVEAQTDAGRVVNSTPSARIEGPNGRNSLAFFGAVQVTVGTVSESDQGAAAPTINGGTEIRRARIGVQGVAYDDFAYQAELDLTATGGVASSARDLWVQYNGLRPFAFTVGNIKPQNGLEASFSDRSNAQTFIESSTLSSMITATGARNIGIRASSGGSNWSASLGYFGDDVNNNGVALPANEGTGFHGRLTFAPIATPTSLLHLGISGFSRDVATGRAATASDPLGGQLRVRAQPEDTIDATRVIDTGNLLFARHANLLALEAAGFLGPVGFQSEWGQLDISQSNGRPDLTFSGAYFAVNWFLTGESRVYDPRTGVFTRFTPRAMMDPAAGTWGAWELAGRWSTIDLNSSPNLVSGATLLGVRGGQEDDYTLGLNWYWNPYLRLMLDYVHADVENRTNSLPGIGADESLTLDLISLRVQQEW